MHKDAIKSIVERLTFVARDLLYPVGHPLVGQKILEVAGETKTFHLPKEGGKEKTEVVKQLLGKHRWGEKCSERYLHGKLNDILDQVVASRSTTSIAEAFGGLVTEFEGINEELTVIVPLVGLQMEMEELAIGKVVLRNMKGEVANQFTKRCHIPFERTTEEEGIINKKYVEEFLAKIRGRSCAEVKAVAEPIRAEEIALEETRRVIDLLRFSILILDKGKGKTVIGIQGEACEDFRATATVNPNDTSFNFMGSVVFLPFRLTQKAIEEMREKGVFEVADLLRKGSLTEFEEVIIRAVHWLASAQAQFENENALLNLVTCLETFLKPAKDDPITATIAEGVAILTASGLEDRKQRRNRVKEFYRKRSTLSHGGRGEILSSDLKDLIDIAGELTVQMIRRKDEFQTQEALRNWIDAQKLTGPNNAITP